MIKSILLTLALPGLLMPARAVLAADAPATEALAVDAPAAESPWRLGVALGYGRRSNPLITSDDITIVIDVDIAWFGKRWFFDNGDVGVTLLDNDAYTLSLVGRLNSDRVFFSKTDTEFITLLDSTGGLTTVEIDVPDRDYAIEAGFEFIADGDWGFLQVAAHHDVSGTHNGYELYANYGYSFRKQRWMLQPSFGMSWKSAQLNDYYWGVREHESSLAISAYRAGAGRNYHARLSGSYQLTPHWSAIGVIEYERLNSHAAASPIVTEGGVVGLFGGLRYRF